MSSSAERRAGVWGVSQAASVFHFWPILCRKSDPRCPGSKRARRGNSGNKFSVRWARSRCVWFIWWMGSSMWGNVTRVETAVSIGWQVASRPKCRNLKKWKRLYISVRSYLQYLLYCFALSYHIPLCFLGLLCNNLYSFACYRCNHFCFRFVVLFFLERFGCFTEDNPLQLM